VSELQLTAPANAGVQKAESVCKPWRLSVSELHTYFVEKRYTESVGNPVVKKRLLRLFSGVRSVIPIALRFALPRKKPPF
jgi:hypothetical protein